MITLYEMTYALTSAYGVYIIYKLMNIFFEEPRTTKTRELISYVVYYVLSSALFFFIRVPFVMMTANIIMFFLLSLNYHSNLKRRMIFSFLAYMVLMVVEVMVSVATGYFHIQIFKESEYGSILGLVIVRIVSLVVVITISRFKNIKKEIPTSNFSWVNSIIISFGSLYFLILFMDKGNLEHLNVFLLVLWVLTINIMLVEAYDNLYKEFLSKSKKLILQEQNKSYEKQLAIMQESAKNTQTLNHDIKNHVITLRYLQGNGEYDNMRKYLDNLAKSVYDKKNFSSSGNYAIDSILNFKLQQVVDMGGKANTEVIIPKDITVSDFDMTVILGNLIDNSIRALKVSEEQGEISVRIKYIKSNIIITVINSFDGNVKYKDGKLQTTKVDSKNHGIGLLNVKEAVERNNGHMDIQYDEKKFKVTVLLPLQ
ncbi:MAG: ATP-binding protein [Gudongella sp.]|nr:ATP-binding protein [Gudongella sp.]